MCQLYSEINHVQHHWISISLNQKHWKKTLCELTQLDITIFNITTNDNVMQHIIVLLSNKMPIMDHIQQIVT